MKNFFLFLFPREFVAVFTVILLLVPALLVPSTRFDAGAACITYSSSSRTITVSCTSATRLTDVNNFLKNPSILKKESTRVWLLAANLVVAKGANFVIDSVDTQWLKIRSDGSVGYGLLNYGNLNIQSVKVTSWNTASNNYASPGSDGTSPRGYIVAKSGGTGKMNIINSHIAHLGYTGTGHHGLDYYGSHGSVVQDSEIDHNYRAFYSSGVGGIRFDRNVVHDNIEYGIDPHSGTHDMYITYNKVYNNNHGIICSVMCYNMHIENNELYNNQRDGIFLDAGSHHSTIKDNTIYNEEVGIQLPSMSYSEVYGNRIYNSKYGINLETQIGSSYDRDNRCGSVGCVSINNNVHHNNIKASSIGIILKEGASTNTIASNTIDGPNGDRGIVVDGSKTSDNIFRDNHISNAKYSIRLIGGNTGSKFIGNHLDTTAPSGEYTMASSSALKLESTQFSSDVIRASDSSSIPVSISKSGTIRVTSGSNTQNYDTNAQPYSKTLTNNGKITVSSLSSTASSIVEDSDKLSALNDNSPEGQEKQAREQAGDHSVSNNNEEDNDVEGSALPTDKGPRDYAGERNYPRKQFAPSEIPTSGLDTTDGFKSKSSQKEASEFNHETLLSLKVRGNGKSALTGTLLDKSTSKPIQGLKIFFTASDPLLRIADATTNKAGQFETGTFSVPSDSGSYKIQAHFAKTGPYDSADSKVITLKVRDKSSNEEIRNSR
jgi:parallel beta-helix repeat protein